MNIALKSLFISLFIFSISLKAEIVDEEEFKNRHIITYLKPSGETKQTLWSMKVSVIDGYDHIDVYRGKFKKPILSNSSELIGHGFNKATVVKFNGKRYLVTKWNSGAHGEEVLLFDLNLKVAKPIWFYVSSWPVGVRVTTKELIIDGTGDMNSKTGEPYKEIKKWNPSMKPMDFSLESEASQSSKSE